MKYNLFFYQRIAIFVSLLINIFCIINSTFNLKLFFGNDTKIEIISFIVTGILVYSAKKSMKKIKMQTKNDHE
jgi:hypothetical protein